MPPVPHKLDALDLAARTAWCNRCHTTVWLRLDASGHWSCSGLSTSGRILHKIVEPDPKTQRGYCQRCEAVVPIDLLPKGRKRGKRDYWRCKTGRNEARARRRAKGDFKNALPVGELHHDAETGPIHPWKYAEDPEPHPSAGQLGRLVSSGQVSLRGLPSGWIISHDYEREVVYATRWARGNSRYSSGSFCSTYIPVQGDLLAAVREVLRLSGLS